MAGSFLARYEGYQCELRTRRAHHTPAPRTQGEDVARTTAEGIDRDAAPFDIVVHEQRGADPKTRPAPSLSRCPAVPPTAHACAVYCTAFIMSKIGKYIATTMPPTMTPSTTIITGSMSDSRDDTATSTSSS